MKKKLIYVVASIFLMVSACATQQTKPVSLDKYEQQVSLLGSDLETAASNHVDILAPGAYSEAQNAFVKARQALNKGEKPETISEYVTESRAFLEDAQETARLAGIILAQLTEARTKAIEAGAEQLGTPFTEAEEQFQKLAKAIGNDNLAYAQKHSETIQTAYKKAEILAIKANALANARKIMAEAEAAKVQKLVPTAYNDALTALNEADAYIGQNPYEVEGIREKATHAELMARRLLALHESGTKFQELSPEEVALYLEGLLVRLGKALKTDDLRDKVTSAQVIVLTDAAMAVVQQRQTADLKTMSANKRISELEEELEGLKGYSQQQAEAREQLEAEREFNQRFNQIQGYFNTDEAEVYKKGNQLIIRLRGIQFPVGQATLTSEDYILLSKVQRAISDFGLPTITIEGHTDSTGSVQTNLRLSEQRAEAVKTYLVANNTLPESHIQATGYGPNNPLAPNTTSENRAINRRIDVVITPEMGE